MDSNKHLIDSWEAFEAWIRDTIGGGFRWKIRPQDTLVNREMVADLILVDIENGSGVFPDSNTFVERVRPKHRDGKRDPGKP